MTVRKPFHKAAPELWRSKRWQGILGQSSDAPLLWHYYAFGPHQTNAGCSRIPPAYACADLQWTDERYQEAKDVLRIADLVMTDDETDEVYVCRWFKHCPPGNPKHAASIVSNINKMDSVEIRNRAEEDLAETKWGQEFLDNPNCAA